VGENRKPGSKKTASEKGGPPHILESNAAGLTTRKADRRESGFNIHPGGKQAVHLKVRQKKGEGEKPARHVTTRALHGGTFIRKGGLKKS